MDGYMDIHTHVLPGVDDGSKDMAMTEAMLRDSYEQGVRIIIATSHNYPGKQKQDNEERRTLTQKVDALAKSIDPEFCVLVGNEIFYRKTIIEDIEEGHAFTLNDSDYVLVEFHPHENYRTIKDGIGELIEHGYYPIIAHVERVDAIFEHEGNLNEILKMGAYLQANMEDFMGGIFDSTSKKLKKMLKSGQLHFFGSDCHDTKERKPLMKDAILYLKKKVSAEAVDKIIIDNRNRFLMNKYIK